MAPVHGNAEAVRIAVLVPTFNERALAATLRALAEEAPTLGHVTAVVVDDGSKPPVDISTLPQPSVGFDLVLARHRVNLGQGAALETARRLALRVAASDVYVTMDADGQHRPSDLPALTRAVAGGADVVFGDRFAGGTNVPKTRALVLRAARLFEWAITGLWLGDAHNGFRAFSPRAAAVVRMRQRGMAHATEIRQLVARAARVSKHSGSPDALVITETPVNVHYDAASMAKGQRSWGAIAILRDLLYKYLFEARP
jgi:glycosyltransferase involved in cell wall biosynthesis